MRSDHFAFRSAAHNPSHLGCGLRISKSLEYFPLGRHSGAAAAEPGIQSAGMAGESRKAAALHNSIPRIAGLAANRILALWIPGSAARPRNDGAWGPALKVYPMQIVSPLRGGVGGGGAEFMKALEVLHAL